MRRVTNSTDRSLFHPFCRVVTSVPHAICSLTERHTRHSVRKRSNMIWNLHVHTQSDGFCLDGQSGSCNFFPVRWLQMNLPPRGTGTRTPVSQDVPAKRPRDPIQYIRGPKQVHFVQSRKNCVDHATGWMRHMPMNKNTDID